MILQYFGVKWDAPMLDGTDDVDIRQIPTPLGEKCLYCEEEILDGEQGLMRWYITGTPADPQGSYRAVHMECDLRAAIGDIHHLRGRCMCFGGKEFDDRPWREQSREVVRWINARRQQVGQCDLQVRPPEKVEAHGEGDD